MLHLVLILLKLTFLLQGRMRPMPPILIIFVYLVVLLLLNTSKYAISVCIALPVMCKLPPCNVSANDQACSV